MAFSGFTPKTLAFLKALGRNNAKDWFDAHRADYEADWLEPGKAFVDAVAEPLRRIAPGVNAIPKVNGSIFRINRDTRFSKDKTPYKDHLDFWFWEGERKTALSGFFARLTATRFGAGAGCHGFRPDHLKRFRAAVAGPAGAALAGIAERIEAAGHTVSGRHYKRPPRGFDADGPAAPFLLCNALWSYGEVPAAPDLDPVGAALERWRVFAPLHRWLMAHVA